MKIHPVAQTAINQYLLAIQVAQRELNVFVQGYMQGLGLRGDYNLDTATWTLKRVPKKEKPK